MKIRKITKTLIKQILLRPPRGGVQNPLEINGFWSDSGRMPEKRLVRGVAQGKQLVGYLGIRPYHEVLGVFSLLAPNDHHVGLLPLGLDGAWNLVCSIDEKRKTVDMCIGDSIYSMSIFNIFIGHPQYMY